MRILSLLFFLSTSFVSVTDAFSLSCTDVLLISRPRFKPPNSKTYYYWRAQTEQNFYIEGKLLAGILEFSIHMKNDSLKVRSDLRGVDVFYDMIIHFGVQNIKSIKGRWPQGDNYSEFIENLKTMSEKKAAQNTWTGRRASDYGFTRVLSVDYINEGFKNSRFAEVMFTRPEDGDVRTSKVSRSGSVL